MTERRDTELDDVLQDTELMHIADLLGAVRAPEPPLDEAFRTGLRRQLMQKAWEMGEGRAPWWRGILAPPRIAWAGGAVGVVLIAAVVILATQPSGGTLSPVVYIPVAGADGVALEKPILVAFNQPMDHASTEAAVQIAPATSVSFTWQANNLLVQPTSGNLAPNTQYQVTIGPGAKTESGHLLAAPQTATFVTQPVPSPTPTPPPSTPPTPTSLVTGEHQVATLPAGAPFAPQWSLDSSTLYFVGANGALDSVAVKGGAISVLVPDGVSAPAIAPAGDRLAYIRGGKVQVLSLGAAAPAVLPTPQTASVVGWVKAKLVWGASDGIFELGAGDPALLAGLPAGGVAAVVSIAPDGGHAVFTQGGALLVLDLATAKSSGLGQAGAQFLGWSPDGSAVLYSSSNGVVVADDQGQTIANLPSGDASWSAQDEILLGSDTDINQVRPDGSVYTKLANGTYRQPSWAPNSTTFAFTRGAGIWSASGPPPTPQPPALDQAAAVVNSFMQARLAGQSDQAKAFLDDAGKQAYANEGFSLLINGPLKFSRYYIIAAENTANRPQTARFVVRLVLAQGKIGVSEYEETLTLQRGQSYTQFLIDKATASPRRDSGKGAEVVGVEVSSDSIKVTFDSDLVSATASAGVNVLDGKGNVLKISAENYANRTVTISGLDLTPDAPYRLVVLTAVTDVSGHAIASEFDLDLVGPASANTTNAGTPSGGQGNEPASSPTPTASPAG